MTFQNSDFWFFWDTLLPSDVSDTHNYEVLNHLIMLKDSRPLVFPVFTFRGIRLNYRDDQERIKETGDMPLPKALGWGLEQNRGEP